MTEQKQAAIEQANIYERKAHQLLEDHKIQESFDAFDRAGVIYRQSGEHLKSAMCFASAATCWNIHTGTQPVKNAATRNHFAALEAMKAENYDYARSLYRDAAMLYEKEGDGESYSLCYMGAQIADSKSAWDIFTGRKKDSIGFGAGYLHDAKSRSRMGAFFRWLLNGWSRAVWGYGERPLRTIVTAVAVILLCALGYQLSGQIMAHGVERPVDFGESLYFSIITFATVGYGDYLPLGGARVIAVVEGLFGISLVPLFLVALTRRYLRLYR